MGLMGAQSDLRGRWIVYDRFKASGVEDFDDIFENDPQRRSVCRTRLDEPACQQCLLVSLSSSIDLMAVHEPNDHAIVSGRP